MVDDAQSGVFAPPLAANHQHSEERVVDRHPEVEAADRRLKDLVQQHRNYIKGYAVRRPSTARVEVAKREYEEAKAKHHPNYPDLD